MLTIPKKATELESLTVRDLRKIALELQISGRSKMKKAELVRTILASNVDKGSAVELVSRSGARSDPGKIQNLVDAPGTLEIFEALPEILILGESVEDEPSAPVESAPSAPDLQSGEPNRSKENAPAAPAEREELIESSVSREDEHAMREGYNSPPSGPCEITLLTVHSRRLFVFWQCDSANVCAARKALGDADATVTLQLSDVTLIEFDEERTLWSNDVAVHSPVGNYYFNDVPPAHVFRCVLGVKSDDGRFHPLARSELVGTPQEAPSVVEELVSAEIRGADDEGPWRSRASEPVERPAGATSGHSPSNSQSDPNDRRHVPVADAAVDFDPRPDASAAPPSTEPEVTPPATGEAVAPVVNASLVSTFNFAPPVVETLPSSLDLASGGPDSSMELAARGPESGVSSLGLIPLVERAPEPEFGAANINPDEPNLELELHAELIVYGRASPEIQVVIDGVRVPVREDGRFDVRFALNHIPTSQ